MKLLTKDTDYAIRALMALGSLKEGYMSAREISTEQGIPYHFLRRVMQVLMKGHVVRSKEGGGGGFRLAYSPGNIRISDIIRLFQGDISFSECMFRKRLCGNRSNCVLRDNIRKIEDKVIREFQNITIKKLINEARKRRTR
jgi:Rrf2 family protein